MRNVYKFFFLVFLFSRLLCIDYGRWTRADEYTSALVISGATNTIRRLAIFNGLTFQDFATACDYSASFPIKGNIDMKGGTLNLQRDLEFEDVVSFISPGNIYGDSETHEVRFPGGLTNWDYTFTFQDVEMIFNSDLDLSVSLVFNSTCTVDCEGRHIDLRSGGSLYINAGADLTLKNVSLVGVKDSNLRCWGSGSRIRLHNSSLFLAGNYTFSYGLFDVLQENLISGSGVFAYQSAQDMTIRSKSTLLVDREVTFSYDSVAASKDKLVFVDETSTFHLRGCTLYSTHTGLKLEGGTIIVEDLVSIESEAQVAAEAMEFSDTLTVNVLAGATFDVVGGIVDY